MFVEVSGEKLVGGRLFAPPSPPILNRVTDQKIGKKLYVSLKTKSTKEI